MTIARNDLPLDAVSINGSYIEDQVVGYMTLKSVGREVILKEINTTPRLSDGSILTNTRYPARSITVDFIIKRGSLADMRTSMEKLKSILDLTDAKVIFNGDSDYYFTGTPELSDDIIEAYNGIVGKYVINCFDPFKYSNAEYTKTAVGGSFSVTYNGTYKSYPTLVATFPSTKDSSGDETSTSECGYVGFADQREHVLQFGDPNETDWADVTYPATVPLSRTFSSITGWTVNGSQVLAGTQVGTVGVNTTNKYAYPSGYSTGSSYHGPSLSYLITGETPPIGKNFNFQWNNKVSGTKAQFGGLSIILWHNESGTRTLVSAVRFLKTTKDTNCGVYLYVGNTSAASGTLKVPCSKIGVCTMKKIDNKVTFTVAGKTVTYANNAITDLIANEVTFHFVKNGSQTALGSNLVYNCKLQRFSFDNYEDIENIFSPGDVLTVNTEDAGVYLDDGSATVPATYLGALGNDWEDFYLVPGSNTIAVDYSDFTTSPPTFTMKYRERFL